MQTSSKRQKNVSHLILFSLLCYYRNSVEFSPEWNGIVFYFIWLINALLFCPLFASFPLSHDRKCTRRSGKLLMYDSFIFAFYGLDYRFSGEAIQVIGVLFFSKTIPNGMTNASHVYHFYRVCHFIYSRINRENNIFISISLHLLLKCFSVIWIEILCHSVLWTHFIKTTLKTHYNH